MAEVPRTICEYKAKIKDRSALMTARKGATLPKTSFQGSMRNRSRWIAAIPLTALALVSLEAAATVTRQNADAFSKKVALIRSQSEAGSRTARRTAVTQDELNSWLVYQAQPHLPAGVSSPKITIVGKGQLS